MAKNRDERGTRYYDDDEAERERRHRRRKTRELAEDEAAAKRERRERRRADDARRQAELDIDELRARRESYYSQPSSERRRTQDRMAKEKEGRRERVKEAPRELRRDGTRRSKRREGAADDRDADYVYGRPKSRAAVEETAIRRLSTRKRSEEGGSSSRTAYTPLSGSGSASLRRGEAPKLSRSMSAREPSRGFLSSRPSVRRTNTPKTPASPPPVSRSHSTRDVARRSTGGLFANLFAKSPRLSTTPVHKEVVLVDCLVCMNDELPVHKTAKLACGHRMCHSCLKRQFTLSVQDPAHMPPRCCTSEHIPLKYADRLFDDKFKILWNKKYQEYTTANRLYCPSKGCGQWIKPSRIRMDPTYGRRYARCGSCSLKVCVLCNEKFHTKRECPKDDETNRLVEMAKEQGWQRCYNCKAVVELKEGCNHMTCRCTAQFCMVCAAPWKTCNCPWFNYQHIEDNDRLNNMRVPYAAQTQHDVVEVIELPDQPSPPPPGRRSSTRTRHRSGRERDPDRAEHRLSSHMRDLHINPTPTASQSRRADPPVEVYGVGNAGGHHMNDSYTMRPAANIAARTIPRSAAPRASFFSRRVERQPPPPTTTRPSTAAASAMAGLSRDGSKRGQNRVGTWLSHVSIDDEAIHTAPVGVEVDDWRCDGTMIGID